MAKKAGLPIKKAEGPVKLIPVKVVHDEMENPTVSKDYDDERKRYKAEDALRDLERAEGHKRNKSLMGDVKKLAKEKMQAMKKIC